MTVDEQIKELNQTLMQVRLDLAKMDTKMDSIKDLANRLERVDNTAAEALQNTKAAHHRLDRIEKILFWVGTTFFGAILVAIAAFLVRGGFAPIK
jgi:uncharacterized coiled-coil protein SlyX